MRICHQSFCGSRKRRLLVVEGVRAALYEVWDWWGREMLRTPKTEISASLWGICHQQSALCPAGHLCWAVAGFEPSLRGGYWFLPHSCTGISERNVLISYLEIKSVKPGDLSNERLELSGDASSFLVRGAWDLLRLFLSGQVLWPLFKASFQ